MKDILIFVIDNAIDAVGNLCVGKGLKNILILITIVTAIIILWFFSPLIRKRKEDKNFVVPKAFYGISLIFLIFGILLGLFPWFIGDTGFLWIFSFPIFFSCSVIYFIVRCIWDRPYDLFTTLFPFLFLISIFRLSEFWGKNDWAVSISAGIVLILMILYLYKSHFQVRRKDAY